MRAGKPCAHPLCILENDLLTTEGEIPVKKIYAGAKRQEISFPLGGIGSGCIGLDGTGRFRDWEIFNRPSKGSINGFSHFAVKAEADGETVDARVMHADLLESHMGRLGGHFAGYGFGPSRHLMSGVPHFRDSEFGGEFPLAEVRFIDETFPGSVKLEAFNPFIPSNDEDSSIPAAFFTAEVRNTSGRALTYTFALTVNNPSKCAHDNRIVRGAHFQGIELADDLADDMSPEYGSIVFGVPVGADMQAQQYWYRGNWFDSLGVFWQNFNAPGEMKNRTYEPDGRVHEDLATIAVRAEVAPGGVWRQRFVIAWHYPNCHNYWSPCNQDDDQCRDRSVWKNYYAKLFADASAAADYAFGSWDRLEEETRRFHDALYSSDLPPEAMDAVGANLSVLKSPTVLRLTDGQFYGFEGCHTDEGCCEGSCTHVWNYAFALPFLFPKLERSMRELDFTYNQGEDGSMSFRLQLPLGSARSKFRPCVDGQMGGIIKTYREWKLCGSDEWLKTWWPKVKKSLEYAWAPTNADRWDPERSGVLTGRQHHTLDMELFGPNAWLNGFYAGALKAAAEMAEAMGDADAALYRKMHEKARAYNDGELFNGEYYDQKVDIRDIGVLKPYLEGSTLTGGSTAQTYWNDEAGQLKYQIAGGCGVDQVLAQWMCALSGVGEIQDPAHVRSALDAIFRHNFKPSLRNHFNPCRIYGLNDESGLVICSWPEGKEKPVVPIPYAEEVMHGFEYQAAVHMIMNGMEARGMRVVQGIRDRYDGEKRNPWNEFECGSNYARSMASYGLLLAYSGFSFDMRRGRMGLRPRHPGNYFWSADGAWGMGSLEKGGEAFSALYGGIRLKEWVVAAPEKVRRVTLNGELIAFEAAPDALRLGEEIRLSAGDCLRAEY